jgi:hypothetical protein
MGHLILDIYGISRIGHKRLVNHNWLIKGYLESRCIIRFNLGAGNKLSATMYSPAVPALAVQVVSFIEAVIDPLLLLLLLLLLQLVTARKGVAGIATSQRKRLTIRLIANVHF